MNNNKILVGLFVIFFIAGALAFREAWARGVIHRKPPATPLNRLYFYPPPQETSEVMAMLRGRRAPQSDPADYYEDEDPTYIRFG